jgi:hypothetical protein
MVVTTDFAVVNGERVFLKGCSGKEVEPKVTFQDLLQRHRVTSVRYRLDETKELELAGKDVALLRATMVGEQVVTILAPAVWGRSWQICGTVMEIHYYNAGREEVYL